ncbi:hypothetical protein IFT47_03180 [Pseudomonas sp. CFBP 13711]|uniref:hypothetical protein n=1 Tax=unclassified Pseudomonas TaxID=196821 RepID=UPI001781C852|nr:MULTISPECIES: hypothetical protein [unclassified Pseudomonas]MBD8705633.1 hypothetical protein [Pseudomonas sp. CFBP 13711]MBD8710668.1 hypothetical protein [Pseudomonas sp. CFBP 13715]
MSLMKGIERAFRARDAKLSVSASQALPAAASFVKPKLTEEEVQAYVDMMLEVTKPKVDKTMEIFLERFPPNKQ